MAKAKAASESGKQKYACFSKEQQKFFDGMQPRQQKYVLLRGKGYSKSEAYRLAGYGDSKYVGQCAYKLENSYPELVSLIDALTGAKRVETVYEEASKYSKAVDQKAKEPPVEMTAIMGKDGNLPSAETMSQDEAERVQFYRQVANGTIKTIKETKEYDKDGNLLKKKIERTSDIDTRMKARRELDRILGIRDVIDIGSIDAGEINITIVDASKREIDEKDKVEIPSDSYEVVDDDKDSESAD